MSVPSLRPFSPPVPIQSPVSPGDRAWPTELAEPQAVHENLNGVLGPERFTQSSSIIVRRWTATSHSRTLGMYFIL